MESIYLKTPKITLSGGVTSSVKTHSMGYKLVEGDVDVSQLFQQSFKRK